MIRHESRTQQRLEERLTALEEQKKLDSEAIDDQLRKRELVEEHAKRILQHRHDLDGALEANQRTAAAEMQQLQIEEEKKKIYLKTKKVIKIIF